MANLTNHRDQSTEALVGQVADEFTTRLQQGEHPDVEEYACRYPHIADVLRRALPALAALVPPPPSAPAEEPLAPRRELGDFRILREIGRGGMGIVYEAEQLSLGRHVALKVLPFAATMDARQLQRFHNEARAAAALYHEHIVPVYAVGCERGVHYYAMQLIDGLSLDDLIGRLRQEADPTCLSPLTPPTPGAVLESTVDQVPSDTPAPETHDGVPTQHTTPVAPGDSAYFRRVAELGAQAADALEYAHALGVVHRDVKPGNLLVDLHGKLWVTDFGLARTAAEHNLTRTGDLLGTLRYMSPEQAQARHGLVDHRTDLYALGATLYELLTLQPAVTGSTQQEVLHRLCFEEPIPPRALNRAVPRDLETVILTALAKNAAERYATARELADDLRRFLADEPVRARRPGIGQRLRRWGRRHRRGVALTFAMTVLLGGGILWSWVDHNARAVEALQKRTAANDQATALLDRADHLHRQRQFAEARAAAREASGLLAGALGDEALLERASVVLRELEEDAAMLARLEDIRQQLITHEGDGRLPRRQIAELHAQAFADYGIPVLTLEESTAAIGVARRAILPELLSGLDAWARFTTDPDIRKQLVRVARRADPQPGGLLDQARQALAAGDGPALSRLAIEAAGSRLPPDALVFLGSLLAELEGVAPAEKFFRAAVRLYPNDYWLNNQLAFACSQLEPPRTAEAIRHCTAALAIRPGCPHTLANLGNALRKEGRFDEALDALDRSIAIRSDAFHAHNTRGLVLLARGQAAEAETAFRRAVALGSRRAHINLADAQRHLGRLDDAITTLQEAIERCRQAGDRDALVGAYTNLGAMYDFRKEPAHSLAPYRAALAIRDNARTRFNLGLAFYHLGRYAEAAAECRRATASPEMAGEAYRILGKALLEQNQPAAAAVAFERSEQAGGNRIEAWIGLGAALRSQGDFHRVLPLLRALHAAMPASDPGRKNVANEIAHCERMLDFQAAHLVHGGITLAQQGNRLGAAAAFRAALLFRPDHVEAHYSLAIALGELGRFDEAIPHLRRAVELRPTYVEAQINLGHALQMLGKFTEAHAEMQKALDRTPPERDDLRRIIQGRITHVRRLLEREPIWDVVHQGEAEPVDAQERIQIADIAHLKSDHALASRLYQEAFADDPALLRTAGHLRAHAACAAARASNNGPAEERMRWRKQALAWLRDELEVLLRLARSENQEEIAQAQKELRRWQNSADLASLREPETLARLPERERLAWQKFWTAVARMTP